MKHSLHTFLICILALALQAAKAQTPQWTGIGPADESFINDINAICSDTSGNIYVGGAFFNAGGKRYIAKWNGISWSELGGNNSLQANNIIRSLSTDVSGNIYTGGYFTNANGKRYVAKWDGNTWSELGGANSLQANDGILSICSDAAGNIYAAGEFENASQKCYVAKWDGNTWSELGGTNALAANSLINSVYSDAAGNIYAAGNFVNASGKRYVAKWDGSTWSELGGINGLAANYTIFSICSDTAGNIYAAGSFTNGITHLSGKCYVAKWDGTTWTELGGTNAFPSNGGIKSMCSDATGKIYAAGYFVNASGKRYVAKWDGSTWSELGGINALAANNFIYSICIDAAGNIYAGGAFINASRREYLAKWDGSSWSETRGTNILAANMRIYSICTDGAGNVYTGGGFTNESGRTYVAKWDGSTWSELGGSNTLLGNTTVATSILSICIDSSSNVYATGTLNNNNGNTYVAKWNGTAWSELGGPNYFPTNCVINSICSDSYGNIYAAGNFYNGIGNSYKHVAKWDGSIWSNLGGNTLAANNEIKSICADASGNIYAAGNFTNSSGNMYVAKWDGSAWSELGGFNSLSANNKIWSIYSDALGNVYAAGDFTNSIGNTFVAKWDGSTWSELGGFNSLSPNNYIRKICSDAAGNLLVAGYFTNANGKYYIAKWDGSTWSELGGLNALSSTYEILSLCTDASGNIYAGGETYANPYGKRYLSKYGITTISAIGSTTFCEGDSVTLSGNNGGIWSNGSTAPSIAVSTSGTYSVISSSNGNIMSNSIVVTVNPLPIAPSISAMGNTTICEGNSLMLMGNNGGTWNNGSTANDFTVNATGNYYVVNSNSCGTDTSNLISINVNPIPLAPNISAMGNTTICEGNSVMLMGNNGNIWSNASTENDIIVNTAGNYYVVSSNSCGSDTSNIISININPLPIAPSISALGNTTICAGSSLMLMGNNGGTWNDGSITNDITVNTAGNYYVISSNSCGSDTSNVISVTLNPLPIAPSISANGSTNLCQGNSLILTGNNGGVWNDGSTALDTLILNEGSYFVTTTNSCGSTVSNTINVNQISVDTAVMVGNASFLANASNATYQWLLCNGTNSPIPSETNQTYTPTMISGFYAVEVTQNGCVDTSACYPLILTGLPNSSKTETIELYPNPANNQLTVDNGQLKIGTFTILNTLGEIVFYKQNCNALETIDLSGFASGIYIVRSNQTSTKFIKQ